MSATNDDQKRKEWERIAQEIEQQATEEEVEPSNPDATDEVEDAQPASASGQLEHPSYQALEDKLTAVEVKMHEYWDQATRANAELKNVQQRAQRKIEEAHKYALKDFVHELIPVIDSLEQALQLQVDDNVVAKQVHEGIELTLKLLLSVLHKFDIEPLDPMGEVFDPERHEAMTMQEQEGIATNTVITVFQKGYLLNGRVIRPARVIVAK